MNGWRLSPAFDMNPVPVDVKQRVLSTAIGIDEDEASLDTALQYGDYFQLGPDEARQIACEVGAAVRQWEDAARGLGLSSGEIQRMTSAFEHDDLRDALNISCS